LSSTSRTGSRGSMMPAAILALVFLLSCIGLLSMGGVLRQVLSSPLSADLAVSDFLMPDGAQLDPEEVTDFLASRLQDRARNDPAIRILLGSNIPEKVADAVIPRLMNVDVMRDMMRQSPSLRIVSQAAQYRALVVGDIANHGQDRLDDVALTLPSLLYAETDKGDAIEIRHSEGRIDAVLLGPLDPGQSVSLRAWLGDLRPELRQQIRLGAASGDGTVALRTPPYGLGSELELMPLAGWLVAGLFGALALVSSIGTVVALLWSVKRG